MEFAKIESMPKKQPAVRFQLATGGSGAPIERWQNIGWHVLDSHSVSETLDDYREYIEASRGELSVAKNLYVATRSGWFSCRSTCYLAAGRPAILQDTGFSEILPTGAGLFAFTDVREAEDAIAAIEADYSRHSRAARELAAEFFDARRVVGNVLRCTGLI
jgi:glycosyltransferase involved in cell wall biosynthesis